MRVFFRSRYHQLKTLYRQYERILIPGMLIFGFVADYLTFTNIEVHFALLVLAGHFALAGSAIMFMQYYDAGRISQKFKFVRLAAPLANQFSFGALLGASFIFYWFSASLSVSWPFMILIAALMVSNEVLRKHMLSPMVQVAAYSFISFSFFSIALPYLLNALGSQVFLLAGLGSVVFMMLYIFALARANGDITRHRTLSMRLVFLVFVIMTSLYYANVIPPIPLSIREAGVYYSVTRERNSYALVGEDESFVDRIIPGQIVYRNLGERLYVYTAIFAPADIRTQLYHQWEYYDERNEQWVKRDRLSFGVTGGRKAGYRGYSFKTNVIPGKWRVSVENERGQALGRIGFTVREH